MRAAVAYQYVKLRLTLPAPDEVAHGHRILLLSLAGLVVLSVATYYWAFVARYGLVEFQTPPYHGLRELTAGGLRPRVALVSAFVTVGVSYWLVWRLSWRLRGRIAWVLVLGGAAASASVLLFMYPIGAADVYDYIVRGRISSIHGANPFIAMPADFRSDPFFRYSAFQTYTSSYGPVWAWIAGAITRVTGDSPVTNVIAFKLLSGVFLAGSAGMLALILRRVAPRRVLPGVVFLTWNPLVLYETMGNGHNDVVIVFCMLAAALALMYRRFVTAVLVLTVGALIKFIPLMLLPAALVIGLRDRKTHVARARFLVLAGAVTGGLVALTYMPFWEGARVLDIEHRGLWFTSSLPAVINSLIAPHAGIEPTANVLSKLAAGLTAAFATWQAIRAPRGDPALGFTTSGVRVLMFYLLATCLWLQQWYALWVIGLAALLPPGHTTRLVVLFGFSMLTKQLIFEPLYIWRTPFPPVEWWELWLGPSVLAAPWAYAGAIVAIGAWRQLKAWNRRNRTVTT